MWMCAWLRGKAHRQECLCHLRRDAPRLVSFVLGRCECSVEDQERRLIVREIERPTMNMWIASWLRKMLAENLRFGARERGIVMKVMKR